MNNIYLLEGGSNLSFTTAGIISFVILTLVSIWSHWLVVKHVGKLVKNLAFTNLQNAQTLQKSSFDLENRRKVEMVAELFALWNQSANIPRGDGHMSIKPLSPDDFKRLNELVYQCAFWLPQNILTDVNHRLGNADGAKDIKQIMMDIRAFLNPDAGAIEWQSIVHF